MELMGFSYEIIEITFVAPDLSDLTHSLFCDSFSLGFKCEMMRNVGSNGM